MPCSISLPCLPPPHHECSAHDLTCIRDSWTARTFHQQATETARPLYLHCRPPAHFYILTGSRSELQQRHCDPSYSCQSAPWRPPHTLQIMFHSEIHVFKLPQNTLQQALSVPVTVSRAQLMSCLLVFGGRQNRGAPS